MAIKPLPPIEGFNIQYRHGDNYVAPVHLPKPGSINVDAHIDKIMPDSPPESIDSTYDPKEIISSQDTPSSFPLLTGIRKSIANKRIQRTTKKIEALQNDRTSEVVRFAGLSMLANINYMESEINGQPNMLRPVTKKEEKLVGKLDHINNKRRMLQLHSHSLANATEVPARPTKIETTSANNNIAILGRTERRISELDNEFSKIMNGHNGNKVEKLIAKREKLTLRSDSLRRQKIANKIASSILRHEISETSKNGIKKVANSPKKILGKTRRNQIS